MDLLESHPGVGRVSRLRCVETSDDLDLVEADLGHESVDDLITAIAALPDSDHIEVTLAVAESITRVDFENSRPLRPENPFSTDLGAPASSMELDRLARVSIQYVLLMICAAVIATAGLVGDLPIAIVGAMAISPDLGRLNMMAFAVILRMPTMVGRASGALALGMVVAITTSCAVALLLIATGEDDPLANVNERLVTFVSVIDGTTVAVALSAGVASMVVFLTERGRAAVGVGVSVTTIPAAAYAGVAAADGAWGDARAALSVLLVNITCVVGSAVTTGLLLRNHIRPRMRHWSRTKRTSR